VNDSLVELHNRLSARVNLEDRRKLDRTQRVKPDPTGYWTDSSMDLRAGLEVVEEPVDLLNDETLPVKLDTEVPERGAWKTD
jgi:hypothetical protein